MFVRYMRKKGGRQKKIEKKFGGNEVKYCGDLRHLLEIYRLKQWFLGLIMLKNKFLGLKMLKNKV